MAENKKKVDVVEESSTVEESNNVLKLKSPILIDGVNTSEIKYDLESLNGNDVQNAMQQLSKRKIQVLVPEVDMNYQAMLFSIASGLSFEDIKRLSLKDFTKACALVRDFFLQE